jgi:hypothetical protein
MTLEARSSTSPGIPVITQIAVLACCAHYPRWTSTGARVGFFPVLRGLPRYSGGSVSTTSLSRPAQASRVLRPARLLAHQKWTLSRGLDPTDQPVRSTGKIYRQLPYQPMTTRVAPSVISDLRRWGAPNNVG